MLHGARRRLQEIRKVAVVNSAKATSLNRRFNKFGWAWVMLCVALAVHVADEAATDFLSVFNSSVRAVHERLPFLPLPVFEFRPWLSGLILAVAVLLAMSPLAFHRARPMIYAARAFAVLMLLNGLGHVLGSIYLGRLMPGVYSAPLLLACSINLLAATDEAGGLKYEKHH